MRELEKRKSKEYSMMTDGFMNSESFPFMIPHPLPVFPGGGNQQQHRRCPAIMERQNRRISSAWTWIPTLYFAEGAPNVLAVTVSFVMLLNLGMALEWAVFWTSLLGLPWGLKPLWSPLLDMKGSKRSWILATECLTGVLLLLIAFSCPLGASFRGFFCIIALFFLIAFTSATHDAAADGYYIIALSEHDQAFYSGLRSAFYKAAVLAGQGGLVMLAGILMESDLSSPTVWMLCMIVPALFFLGLRIYHGHVLPELETDRPGHLSGASGFLEIILSFFRKKKIVSALLFLLFYRFAEAQLKVAVPFLLNPRESGGLGLSIEEQGFLYGTCGMAALIAGGIAAGFLVARDGIGKWFWPMALAINLPDFLYVYLAFAMPENLLVIGSCIFIEQFGYGFGLTGAMLFMVFYTADSGSFKTSHFALMTGITAIGLSIPGMFSGHLMKSMPSFLASLGEKIPEWGSSSFLAFFRGGDADQYRIFFLWIVLCTAVSFYTVHLVSRGLDPSFGKSRTNPEH